jgi:hypothetical protein
VEPLLQETAIEDRTQSPRRGHTLLHRFIHLMNRNYGWAVSDLAAKTVGGVERRNMVELCVFAPTLKCVAKKRDG